MTGIAIVCIALLLLAAFFHFYWGFGGQRGLVASLPQKPDGSLVFKPPTIAAHGVGVALIVACVFIITHMGYIKLPVPEFFPKAVVGLLALVFFVRAFGWFEYVGLFKKVRHTTFAHYDTYLYCPLFIFLAFGVSVVFFVAP